MRCGLEVEVYLVAPLCRGMLCACTIPSRADDGPWSSYGQTIPFLYGTRTRSVVGGVASPPSCPWYARCVQVTRLGEGR